MLDNEWKLDKESMDWMRSIAAISVVIIHCLEYSTFPIGKIFNLIKKCGFVCVSIFLFQSGVGLTLSMKKSNYFKNYLQKRFFKLLLPLYLTEFICIGINIVTNNFNYIGNVFFFWKYVPYSWYVVSISVVYILFWISNNLFNSYHLFIVLLILVSFSSYLLEVPIVYFKCCPSLIIGCGFAYIYQKSDCIKQHPIVINLCMWGGAILAFYLSKYGNALMKGCLISGAASLLCASSTYWIKSNCIIWKKISQISYELYLIHGFVILRISVFNKPVQILECLLISIVGAFFINLLYRRLYKLIL